MDLPVKRFDNPAHAFQQGRFAAAIGTKHGEQAALLDHAVEVMHRRMPVVAKRHIIKTDGWLRGVGHSAKAHNKSAHITAVGSSASATRCGMDRRNKEKSGTRAGVPESEVRAWLWLWLWPCEWLWLWEAVEGCGLSFIPLFIRADGTGKDKM